MLKLTITGQTTTRKYPVVELQQALEQILDDLDRFTVGGKDTPEDFSKTYPTAHGQLTATLEKTIQHFSG